MEKKSIGHRSVTCVHFVVVCGPRHHTLMELCHCLDNVKKASGRSEDVALIQRRPRRGPWHLEAQAESVHVSYTQVYAWHAAVETALEVDDHLNERFVVGIHLMPFSIEETAMLVMVAAQRQWTYVPVDPHLSLAQQRLVLEQCGVHRLVSTVEHPLVHDLMATEARSVTCRLVEIRASPFASVLVAAFARNASVGTCHDEANDAADRAVAPLYVLCTSGSTGTMKRVVGSRTGAWTRLEWMWQMYPFERTTTEEEASHERVMRSTKLSFVDSVWEILGAFVHAVPLVHLQCPRHDVDSTRSAPLTSVVLDDSRWFLDVVRTERVTRFTAVPSVLEMLVLQTTASCRRSCLARLRYVLSSGEALPLHVLEQLTASLPHVTILNLYGSTEVSGDVTCMALKAPFSSIQVAAWQAYGVPVATLDTRGIVGGAQTSLLLLSEDGRTDSRNGSSIVIWPKPRTNDLVASNAANDRAMTGVLYIAGPLLAYGYDGDTQDDAFVRSSQLPRPMERDTNRRSTWFCTGDICSAIQGRLYFRGRKDHAIKIHGQRVYMEAVERAVANAWKTTTTDANMKDNMQVIAFPTRKKRTNRALRETHIVACIISDDSKDTQSTRFSPSKAFHDWIAEHYGTLHIPFDVFRMPSEAVPRATSGKINRQALEEVYKRTEFRESNRSASSLTSRVENRGKSATEGILGRLLHEILDISPRDHSLDDLRSLSFRELGGNSLVTTLFVHELRQQFGGCPFTAEDVLGMTLEQVLSTWSRENALHDDFHEEKQGKDWIQDPEKTVAARVPNTNEPKRQKTARLSQDDGSGQNTLIVVSRCNQSSLNRTGVYLPACYAVPVSSTEETVPGWLSSRFSLQRVWAIDLGKCIDASPVVVQRRDRKGHVESTWAIIGSHSAQLVCVDVVAHGCEIWRVTLDDRIEAGAAVSVKHEIVYIGTYAGSVYALNLQSGITRWRFQANGSIKASALVVEEQRVVICGAYDNFLYGLDAVTGKERWNIDLSGSLFSTPCYCAWSTQLISATTQGSVLALLSVSTFRRVEKQWNVQLPAPVFAGLNVASTAQILTVGCADGYLYGLALATGDVHWQVATEKPIFSSPCVYAAESTVFGSHDGKLRKVNCRTGNVVWTTDLRSAIFASPTVVRCLDLNKAMNASDSWENERRLCCVSTTAGSLVFCDELTGSIVYQTSNSTGIETNALFTSDADDEEDFGPLFSSPVMIDSWCLLGTRTNCFYGFKIISRR
ncbi:hypothetical protein PsorP6_007284 [Peronosclerospora sorghi]|uniref:Uncharacterized protein n=1 Tax=Peronosclerospora sorghi TaxID=230839 RepID=A0ACC0WBP0_9STRA|nr:hypothetical protein PsorP6_007284 [Peronosclerospora sorghi]